MSGGAGPGPVLIKNTKEVEMLRIDHKALRRHMKGRLLGRYEVAKRAEIHNSIFSRLSEGVRPRTTTIRKLIAGLDLTIEGAVAEGILVEAD